MEQRQIKDNILTIVSLIEEQNKILKKNTIYTGIGSLTGIIAIVIAVISILIALK